MELDLNCVLWVKIILTSLDPKQKLAFLWGGGGERIITIYALMIYTARCIMFWMRAYPLRGQVGGGWAREIESFLVPLKWHRADRRMPCMVLMYGVQKLSMYTTY